MMSRDLTNIVDQSGIATNHPFLRKLIADGGFHFGGRFWPFTPQVTRFERLAQYDSPDPNLGSAQEMRRLHAPPFCPIEAFCLEGGCGERLSMWPIIAEAPRKKRVRGIVKRQARW